MPTNNFRNQQTGFTLIELMLVALLMGLVAATVMFTVDSSQPQKNLKRQAMKMAALTEIALDQATMTGRDFGLVIGLNEYRFVELFEQRWQPLEDDILVDQQLKLAEIVMTVDGFAWTPDQIDFSSSNFYRDRENDYDLDEQEKEHTPQVLLLSSGELTPFKIEFKLSDNGELDLSELQQQYQVNLSANTLGMITVEVLSDE